MYAALEDRQHREAAHALASAHSSGKCSAAQQVSAVSTIPFLQGDACCCYAACLVHSRDHAATSFWVSGLPREGASRLACSAGEVPDRLAGCWVPGAQAAAAVLGVGEGEVAPGRSFRQLGGDSLAAVAFAQRLERLTGAAVPVAAILDGSHTLARIAAQVGTPRPPPAARMGP